MMTESSSTHTTYLDDLKAETLRKFQADTGEMDPQRAIQVLDDCDWDLNASITSYRSGISRNTAPAQPASGGWLSYFWNFGYGFLSAFLPSQTDVDPAVAASRFLSEFERQYDAVHPAFLEMSFQNACKRAKEEFKFLVVYLHSSLHQHTDQFCRETLSTDLIAEFVNENFLFWAGSVTYPEAYKTSLLLGASTYPFIAVVCNNSVGGLTICDRIEEGLIDSERLMMRLSGALEQFGPTLLAAKLEYEERNQSRLIREEQDRAFTESLREDEAKQQRLLEQERRQREEQEATEKEERARLRKAEEKQRTKEEIRKNLPGEPEPGEGTAHLVIRLTDGSRLQRRFRKTDTLQIVFDFVDSSHQELERGSYDLVSNFPRKVFTDRTATLDASGLYPHASLFVQEK